MSTFILTDISEIFSFGEDFARDWKFREIIPRSLMEAYYTILKSLPKDFRRSLLSLLNSTDDGIFYGPVQSGKTRVQLDVAWILHYRFHQPVIMVAWERCDVLHQLQGRIRQYNQDHPTYPLPTVELTPRTTPEQLQHWIQQKYIITTIMKPERINKLFHISQSIVVIMDEGDMSVKHRNTVMERSLRTLLSRGGRFYYFSATNFALYNDSFRNTRRYQCLELPTTLYPNLVYRGYFDMEHYITENMVFFRHDHEDPQVLADLVAIIQVLNDDPQNLGLMNLVRENHPKYELGKKISAACPWLVVVAYTGDGFRRYDNGNLVQTRNNSCVEQYLQELKNLNLQKPILMISTGMASRSQTFKSLDQEMILTHLFLDLSTSAGVDTVVQSLRVCGQYRPEQPLAKIYASRSTHKRIENCLLNNMILELNAHRPDVKIYDYLPELPFLCEKNQLTKFTTRNQTDRVHYQKWTYYDAETDTREKMETMADFLRNVNRASGIRWLTTYQEIPITDFTEFLKTIGAGMVLKQMEGDRPYEGIPEAIQKQMRRWIWQRIGLSGKQSLQLCYSEDREEKLNHLYHDRHDQFIAKVAALSHKNVESIPVVIWDQEYIDHKERFQNQILVWHTTSGKYRAWVNREMKTKTFKVERV